MRQEEYRSTIVYNGHMINIGLDDYGQQYFIEFLNDSGELVELGCGAYNSDYQHEIEYLFGDAEKCPHANEVDGCCGRAGCYGFCHDCQFNPLVIAREKRMNKNDASGAVYENQ